MVNDTVSHPNIETLKKFKPLALLGEPQLKKLSAATKVREASAGKILIKRGSTKAFSFFLIEGKLKLTADDEKILILSANDPSTRNPISQLLPRRYQVESLTRIRFLAISQILIDELREQSEVDEQSIQGYVVSGEGVSDQSGFEDEISYAFLRDLEDDKVILPSLPEVAAKINRALRDSVSDAHVIAEIIQNDPVITAKIIKAANSAMYGSRAPVKTCAAGVIRLGTDATHKLVLSYSMKELFQSNSPVLKQHMKELWDHSTKVAALCYVLAQHDARFNPEEAMLIGLLHDIGAIAVLKYLEDFPERLDDSELINKAIENLKPRTGSLILRRWGFSQDFLVTALEAEQWMRNEGPDNKPDYCDIVIIAQLHSFIGTKNAPNLPAMNEVPAHRRLDLGELTPRLSLKIIEAAQEQLAHAEGVLNF